MIFESQATNVGLTTLRKPDVNGVADAMLATEPSGERWLLAERAARGATTNPMTSPHGNYVVFERGGHVHLALRRSQVARARGLLVRVTARIAAGRRCSPP